MHIRGQCQLCCLKCFILASIASYVNCSPIKSEQKTGDVDKNSENGYDIAEKYSGKNIMSISRPSTEYPSRSQWSTENYYSIEEANLTPNVTDVIDNGDQSNIENWCVIWYLGAFGSLVCFFLVITCTELFFGSPLYRRNADFIEEIDSITEKPPIPQTPPPPYHLFAPPDYKEVVKVNSRCQIYIIPVREKS